MKEGSRSKKRGSGGRNQRPHVPRKLEGEEVCTTLANLVQFFRREERCGSLRNCRRGLKNLDPTLRKIKGSFKGFVHGRSDVRVTEKQFFGRHGEGLGSGTKKPANPKKTSGSPKDDNPSFRRKFPSQGKPIERSNITPTAEKGMVKRKDTEELTLALQKKKKKPLLDGKTEP